VCGVVGFFTLLLLQCAVSSSGATPDHHWDVERSSTNLSRLLLQGEFQQSVFKLIQN